MHNRVTEILLVEDNPGDVRLTQEAFKRGKLPTHLNVVSDGEEAMSYLHREGKFQDATLPDLILLDLNLPRKSGLEVLAEIKADPKLGFLPVIILSSSNAERDVLKTYSLHASCYIPKPVDFEQFIAAIRQIESFWLGTVQLPRAS